MRMKYDVRSAIRRQRQRGQGAAIISGCNVGASARSCASATGPAEPESVEMWYPDFSVGKGNHGPCRSRMSEDARAYSLQFGVLGLGFFQDGNIGVGIFPGRKEVLVSCFRFGFISLQRVGPSQIPAAPGYRAGWSDRCRDDPESSDTRRPPWRHPASANTLRRERTWASSRRRSEASPSRTAWRLPECQRLVRLGWRRIWFAARAIGSQTVFTRCRSENPWPACSISF